MDGAKHVMGSSDEMRMMVMMMMMVMATMTMTMKRRIEIAQACDLLVFGQTQV